MRGLLRSLWDEPPPSDAPRRVWRDWVVVAVLAVAVVLEGALRPSLPYPIPTVAIALGLLPTLLWRRSRPLAMIAVVFGVLGLVSPFIGGEPTLKSMVYVLLLPYAVFRWGSGRAAVLGSAVMLGKLGVSMVLGQLTLGNASGGLAVLAVAGTLGMALRYRASAHSRELDRVRLLEREGLARDMHDTVAHHVSAMAIRAQAGIATAATDPDAAVDALRLIEAEASRALAEMRSMVRLLRRGEPADRAPNPRVSDVVRLASQATGGPSVEVEIVGDLEELDRLPASLGAAIYRLVQESVTNAKRHARHATRIQVQVVADGVSVRLRVSDDGDTSLLRMTPGYGVLGMIERADLLGGSCQVGPNPGRGWTVTAVLPLAGAAR